MNAPPLPYVKACEIEDFAHPDLRDTVREVFHHELARLGPEFPSGREYRKHWEVAMAVRTLRDGGASPPTPRSSASALGTSPRSSG